MSNIIQPNHGYKAINEASTSNKRQCSCPGRRYYTAICLSLAIFCEYLMRINLSVAIEPMACQFKWSHAIQGFILSSFFIGYTFGNILGGWLSTKYGGKNVLLFSVLSTSCLTLLIPFCTSFSFGFNFNLNCKCLHSISKDWCFHDGAYTNDNVCKSITNICDDKSHIYLLIILRIFMGFFEAFSFPALFAVLKGWSVKQERSKLMGIAVCGGYLGTMIGFPVSTLLIGSNNHFYGSWVNVFYLFAIIGVLWAFLFYFTVFDEPTKDKFISTKELLFITSDSERYKKDELLKNIVIPWKNMLTNKVAWAIYVAAFSFNFINYTLLTELPTYLNDQLNYDLSNSLIISILPFLCSGMMQFASGYIVDFWINSKLLSRTNSRRLAHILASIIPGILLVICGYLENSSIIVSLIIFSALMMGLAASSFFPNFVDISPSLSNVLYGICNTIATVPGVLAPIVIGLILNTFDSETTGWKFVFWIVFMVSFGGTTFYAVFTDTKIIPALNIGFNSFK